MNSPVKLVIYPAASTPKGFFQSEVLRLYFPALKPWAAQSVLLPSCSSQFIRTQMWDPLVHQPLPHPTWSSSHHIAIRPLHPSCLSPSLLLVWMNVSSFAPWLVGFHTVWFSVSSGLFFIFKFVCLLVVQGGKVYLPTPPSWPEVPAEVNFK